MNDENPLSRYFLVPSIQKGDAVRDLIHSLRTFRERLQEEARGALDDLLGRAESHLGKAYLSPGCEPIEFLLLTMLIEQRKELLRIGHEIDGVEDNPSWKKGDAVSETDKRGAVD